MIVGDYKIEADSVGWKAGLIPKGKTKSGKEKSIEWHYFGRLDHLADWLSDDVAHELVSLCATVAELDMMVRQKLMELE